MHALVRYGKIVKRIYAKRQYQMIALVTVLISLTVSIYLYYISETLEKELHSETIKKVKIITSSVKKETKISILLADTPGLKLISNKVMLLDKNVKDVAFFDDHFTPLLGKAATEKKLKNNWSFIVKEQKLFAFLKGTLDEQNKFVIQITYDLQSNSSFIFLLRVKALIFIFFLLLLLNIILFVMFFSLEKKIAETEKSKLSEELAHSKERNQRLFLANMSHEIRTPLSGIMGLLSLLKKTNLTERQNKYLSAIDTSSKTLLTVINDILDLAKIERGEVSITTKPFNIKNTINQIYDLFIGKCVNKNLKFTNAFDGKLPVIIFGDQARINQIIYNLVGNAIKFTSAGFVSIRSEFDYLTEQNGKLVITIQDSGIGIPDDKIQDIFSPFRQVEDYESRKFEGTGLGLSISKKMITLMGGTIEVNSNLGSGSVFCMTIPFDDAESEIRDQLKECSIYDLTNIEIPIAEDNPINQLMAGEMLTQEGAHVTIVENGLEAIKIIDKKHFDIILMDMQMPVMNGYEAIEKIRANKKTADYKIIALTAHVNETELKKCLDAGADRYLSKPFVIEDLKREIHFLISI